MLIRVRKWKRKNSWELVAIITLVSSVLLAGVVYGLMTYRKFGPPSRKSTTRVAIKNLVSALEIYKLETKDRECPENLSGLVERRYILSLPRDAWGEEFFYRYPGEMQAGKADVISKGPDKILGTGDDLME